MRVLKDLGLNLVYAVNTHVHADHITGTHKLRQVFTELTTGLGNAYKRKRDKNHLNPELTDEVKNLMYSGNYNTLQAVAYKTSQVGAYKNSAKISKFGRNLENFWKNSEKVLKIFENLGEKMKNLI